VAVGGAACGGRDESPEPSAGRAGSSSTGGSGPTGGTSTAGHNAVGGAAGKGGTAGNTNGGSSAGESAGCCSEGDSSTCTADGEALKACMLVMGSACSSTAALYAYVWQVQACPNGCISGSSGGAASFGGSSPDYCQ
jgi:hypothetical protein